MEVVAEWLRNALIIPFSLSFLLLIDGPVLAYFLVMHNLNIHQIHMVSTCRLCKSVLFSCKNFLQKRGPPPGFFLYPNLLCFSLLISLSYLSNSQTLLSQKFWRIFKHSFSLLSFFLNMWYSKLFMVVISLKFMLSIS